MPWVTAQPTIWVVVQAMTARQVQSARQPMSPLKLMVQQLMLACRDALTNLNNEVVKRLPLRVTAAVLTVSWVKP